MSLSLVAILVVVPLAALAASHGAGWKLFSWSLVFSFLLLVLGAVPFYLAETTAPAEGGAPFILLGWIVAGPFLTFVLLPLMYGFSTWRRLTGPMRRFGLPLAVSVLISVFLAVSVMAESGELMSEMLVIIIPAGIVILVAWLVYLAGMDWARRTSRPVSPPQT